MASRTIPARLNKFNVYTSANKAMGVATVTLPSIEGMSDTLTGAGVMGEIEMPTLGHIGSMETELEWNTITGEAVTLAPGVSETLTFRGAMQVSDSATGGIKAAGVRVVMSVVSKTLDLGSMEIGSATGTTNTLEVIYLKIIIDGKDVLEIGKLTNVYKVNGKDLMADFNALS